MSWLFDPFESLARGLLQINHFSCDMRNWGVGLDGHDFEVRDPIVTQWKRRTLVRAL
jgi:hypothetical protein